MKIQLFIFALLGFLLGLLYKNKNILKENHGGGGGGGGGRGGGGGMAGVGNTYRGPGGITLSGAVYGGYGSPYGYPSDIMPDCYDKCCNRTDCDYGFGCRWESGGNTYTGRVLTCQKHKECVKQGGSEETCKKEVGSLRLV